MEDKLIESVEIYPCLYDKSKKEYRSKQKKEKSWAAVSAATGVTVEQCKSRWRSLRDRYVREIAKSGAATEETRKWRYMDALSFLQEHVASRRKFSNMQWASSEHLTLVETEDSDMFEEITPYSQDTSSTILNNSFDEYDNNVSTEEEIPRSSTNHLEKRRKVQYQAHEKFDELCGVVSDLIAAKKESCEKSRNTDFLKVLDSYLLKHSEEEQDRLKIEILNLVYNKN